MTSEQYVSTSKMLTIVATILLLLAGWLFTMMINSQDHMRDRQERHAERLSVIEAKIGAYERQRMEERQDRQKREQKIKCPGQ